MSKRQPQSQEARIKKIPIFSKEGREILRSLLPVVSTSDSEGKRCEERESLRQPKGSDGEGEVRNEPAPTATLYQTKEPTCLTCSEVFHSREEQVEHYRLDWHRYNLKRKLKGLEAVDQDSFEKIAGDLSSISGSESSSSLSDDEQEGVELRLPDRTHRNSTSPRHQQPRSPYLHFSLSGDVGGVSPTHSIYSCIVTGSHGVGSEVIAGALRGLRGDQVWIILMLSGGHFASAVFRGLSLVAHKTFHRYTVRAKRGTAQSVRDGQQGGHQPKSAGASLRRYNEAALTNEIRELMTSWLVYIEEASCIFIRTPKYSRGVLVGDGKGGKAPFMRTDPRLRGIPFPTRRPTLKEVQGVHEKLAAIYVGVASREVKGALHRGENEREDNACLKAVNQDQSIPNNDLNTDTGDFSAADLDTADPDLNTTDPQEETPGKTRRKKKAKKPAQPAQPVVQVPEFIQRLLAECGLSHDSTHDHVTVVTAILEQAGLPTQVPHPPESATLPSLGNLKLLNSVWNGTTVLHTASEHGCSSLIPILLLHGADPAVKNGAGHTPYLVAQNKGVRDAFRRFMAAHPAAYRYERAHIPSPLTPDMEQERNKKEAEKKREKKKARKQREKVRREGQREKVREGGTDGGRR